MAGRHVARVGRELQRAGAARQCLGGLNSSLPCGRADEGGAQVLRAGAESDAGLGRLLGAHPDGHEQPDELGGLLQQLVRVLAGCEQGCGHDTLAVAHARGCLSNDCLVVRSQHVQGCRVVGQLDEPHERVRHGRAD